MTYNYDTKKWYIATKNGKYFYGELDTINSLTGNFESIEWYDNEDTYTTECEVLGLEIDTLEVEEIKESTI